MKICPTCKKQYDSTVNICPEDNEILEENLAALVGKTLDGQYLIEKLLGQGGMGAVFLARHTMLGDQVAIKVMPSGISKSSDYQRRFLREAKTARQFSHANVVAVHDLRTTQDGMFYMVLEYVNGHTLNDELKKRRKFLPKEAVDILNPIGDALTMAHSLGIIHRDLKPDNIMIGKAKDGSMLVKLLDLGIAKVKSVDVTALTVTGQILGTPHYMSPEQWNGDEIDGRADIYSLGIILYELVAGVRPFSGKTIQKLAYEHSVTTAPLLCKIVGSVSEEFSKVVEKALEKEPDKRPNGCQELFAELKNALKYEVYSNEDLLQCETLVTSKPIGTVGFSGNNTTQENQVTLIAKTENTHAESKQVAEKTFGSIATLV
ncbi:MAG: serine/threonine protein kinase/WD40 repeat-containing protein, partial [bacterium]